MAPPLTEPPKSTTSIVEWATYFFRLFRHVRTWTFVTEASGDAAATISAGVGYHGVTALTAGRTITLPASADLDDGRAILIQDESGAAGTYNITVIPQGSDTVNGGSSAVISSNYGRLTVVKRVAGKFYAK